ncbi:hypothetical protein [Streptomyces sp. NPDC087437]|uniref:hypothetical protein n=1 Tax=Streptomyces sp. NPDC087437 TaxID=3365789 RepID=UPI00381968F4
MGLSRLLRRLGGEDFVDLGRLWLNARHLSRYRPNLLRVVAEQEAIMRDALTAVIEDGVRAGDFTTDDALGACVVILVAVDGLGSYANDDTRFTHPALDTLLFTTAERELGLEPGRWVTAADVCAIAADSADSADRAHEHGLPDRRPRGRRPMNPTDRVHRVPG